jgi:hypothetical protein
LQPVLKPKSDLEAQTGHVKRRLTLAEASEKEDIMGKIDRSFPEAARSLTGGLRAKSRRRRESLKSLTASSLPARVPRNDLLPPLDLVYVILEDLRIPAREVRKLDPVHVREVANSIRTLGFCAPILIGKDNLILDGAVRVQAARFLGLGRAPCTSTLLKKPDVRGSRRNEAESERAQF